MLRRGVAVGTAVWTVPTITAITLTPANAASPSGEPPTEPPKPPTEPPKPPTEPPTEPPSNETTPPPSTETTPPPSNETTPPGKPSATPPPPGDEDDDTAGGGLPNTGPGDVAQGLAVGGLLTAAGAAMYVASRKESPEPGDAQPGATV